MTSMFQKTALGLALAVAAVAANAPAQAQEMHEHDGNHAYSQVGHDDRGYRNHDGRDYRGYRSERYRHLTRSDEYRMRYHHSSRDWHHEREGRRGY